MPIGTCEKTQDTQHRSDEAQPISTAELRREGRLARIAKALASGATVTDIAEAEGIGRTLASREANSPECRQLIAEFVSSEHDEMRAMFYRSLCVIDHESVHTKDGQIVLGPTPSYCRSQLPGIAGT